MPVLAWPLVELIRAAVRDTTDVSLVLTTSLQKEEEEWNLND